MCNVEFADIVVWIEHGITVEWTARDRSFYDESVQMVEPVWSFTRSDWEMVHEDPSG